MSDQSSMVMAVGIPGPAVEILRCLAENHGLRLAWSPRGSQDKPSRLTLTPRGVEGSVRWDCECSSALAPTDMRRIAYLGTLRGTTMACMRDFVVALESAATATEASAKRAKIPARKRGIGEAAETLRKLALAFGAALPTLREAWPVERGEAASDVE